MGEAGGALALEVGAGLAAGVAVAALEVGERHAHVGGAGAEAVLLVEVLELVVRVAGGAGRVRELARLAVVHTLLAPVVR